MSNSKVAKTSLTGRYSVIHGSYWSLYGAVFSFAAAFLLSKGFSSAYIGILLALATLISCAVQPFLAAAADRSSRLTLRGLILLFSIMSWLSMAILLFIQPPSWIFAVIYLIGALLLDLMQPLINALSVYCNSCGIRINYGYARGVGSISFAAATYMLGHAMERFNSDVVLIFSLGVYVVFFVAVFFLPRIKATPAVETKETVELACTLMQFFLKYKWYCISLTGIFFMAAFHVMTENYMIVILENVGGDSGDLGTVLALATVLETPMVMMFSRYRHFARTGTWLKIASLSFLLKSLLLFLAPSVLWVTASGVLQPVSYGLYAAAAVYYAGERVAKADMVKGQAMLTAFYALGNSLGNFIGGRLLEDTGVRSLLICGIILAAVGAAIMWLSAGKTVRIGSKQADLSVV